MYPVSNEFQEKIKDPKNRRVYARLEVDYTDISLDESIDVITSDLANVSYPAQVSDNVSVPIGKILSLDTSSKLDGSYVLAPTPSESIVVQMGWWGGTLSNVDGTFNSPYPTLQLMFNPRPIVRLRVTGDDLRKEYPVDFNINLYDENEILLYSEIVTNNDNIFYLKELSIPIANVTTIELEVLKWSHGNRQVKIMELYTAIREVYEGEDIISLSLLEEKEVTSTGLPIGNISSNEIRLKLNNETRKFDGGNTQSPLYDMLRPNRRIKGYLGIERDNQTKEYVPLGTFWSEDWDVPENMAYASTVGRDRLKFLEETLFEVSSPQVNVTLYDLAENVLLDAGLTESEYIIDDVLGNYTIPVVFTKNPISHREMLRLISEVSMGQVYCDRNNIIKVEGYNPLSEVYNIAVNEENDVSCLNQLVDGVDDSDSLYIMLDGHSMVDGSYSLITEDCSSQIGWIGTSVSDINGYFTGILPMVTLEFQEKSIGEVKIVGDSLRNEYPVDYTIRLYDIVGNLILEKIIIGNSNVINGIVIPENPTNVTKLTVEISRWSTHNTSVKIIELKDLPYQVFITNNEYFRKNNPVRYTDMANHITVIYTPMSEIGETSDGVRVVSSDEVSILRNGVKRFEINGNFLIQTQQLAEYISETILENFKDPNRNIELDWRGNPAILLGDIITVVDDREENKYRIASQTLDYMGALRSKIKGKKVV